MSRIYMHRPILDRQARVIRERAPGVWALQFAGCRHMLLLDRAARVNALLSELAASLGSAL